MNVLFILNGPAYGTELSYNGFRLAGSLARREGAQVRVFLMGDGVSCAVTGQQVPEGYYRLDRMVDSVLRHGGSVACCGTCLNARGIDDARVLPGVTRSTLEELTDWTLWADKVVTF